MATVTDEQVATVTVPAKVTTALERQGAKLVADVEALVVRDDDSYRLAVELAKLGRQGEKDAEEVLRPVVDANHSAWKVALDVLKKVKAPFTRVAEIAGEKRLAYEDEQRRLREEAERQAREEQERLEREAREAAEAEAARLRALEEDRRLAEAVDLEARGDTAGATKLLEEPVVAPTVVPAVVFAPPVAVAAPPKVDGASSRSDYSAKLVDLSTLVKAAAAGNTNALACLAFDQASANRLARALKKTLQVPGVEVVEKRVAITKT